MGGTSLSDWKTVSPASTSEVQACARVVLAFGSPRDGDTLQFGRLWSAPLIGHPSVLWMWKETGRWAVQPCCALWFLVPSPRGCGVTCPGRHHPREAVVGAGAGSSFCTAWGLLTGIPGRWEPPPARGTVTLPGSLLGLTWSHSGSLCAE